MEATLEAIARVFPAREAALCRELTKLHEEVLRDAAPALLERVRERGEMRGEMVVVVAPPAPGELSGAAFAAPSAEDAAAALERDIACGLAEGESAGALAKRLAQKYSRRKREVYALVLEAQEQDGDA